MRTRKQRKKTKDPFASVKTSEAGASRMRFENRAPLIANAAEEN